MTIPDKISNKKMDWKEHVSTYNWVIAAFKYSSIGLVLLLVGMLVFLV